MMIRVPALVPSFVKPSVRDLRGYVAVPSAVGEVDKLSM